MARGTPNVRRATTAASPEIMNTWPWASVSSRTTPKTRAYPIASSA
jgi:hypothetical protein